MKVIIISINPKHSENIKGGKKILEIRKSIPKCNLPIDVYIYETLGSKKECGFHIEDTGISYRTPPLGGMKKGKLVKHYKNKGIGKIVGKFTLNEFDKYKCEFCEDYLQHVYEDIRMVLYNEELEDEEQLYITSNEEINPNNCDLLNKSCLTFEQIKKYIGSGTRNTFYSWHIDNLIIFDDPIELNNFYKIDSSYNNSFGWIFTEKEKRISVTKAPQSWCYAAKDN